jgi:hypothetical protein
MVAEFGPLSVTSKRFATYLLTSAPCDPKVHTVDADEQLWLAR